MVKNFFDSLFSSKKDKKEEKEEKKQEEKKQEDVELVVISGQSVPINNLNLQTITYRFGDITSSPQLKLGQMGMVHHCFSNQADAQQFLDTIRKQSTDGLSQIEIQGLARARVTKTGNDPSYVGADLFRVRLSFGQFKFFASKSAQVGDDLVQQYKSAPPKI